MNNLDSVAGLELLLITEMYVSHQQVSMQRTWVYNWSFYLLLPQRPQFRFSLRIYVTLRFLPKDCHDTRVVCYYSNWPYYREGEGKYLVENIEVNLCTHLVYSFVVLDPSSHVIKIHDDWLDVQLGNLKKFTALRASHPGVKLLVALGGWTDSRKPGFANSLVWSWNE